MICRYLEFFRADAEKRVEGVTKLMGKAEELFLWDLRTGLVNLWKF